MNRSTLLKIAVGAALLIVAGAAQTGRGAAPASQIGRYRLLSGEATSVGSNSTDKVILRLDTATGDVDEWLYGALPDGKPWNQRYRIGEAGKKQ